MGEGSLGVWPRRVEDRSPEAGAVPVLEHFLLKGKTKAESTGEQRSESTNTKKSYCNIPSSSRKYTICRFAVIVTVLLCVSGASRVNISVKKKFF